MSHKLKIKAKTWNKDSYELYDYEATDFNAAEFTSEKSGIMIRKSTHLKYMNELLKEENLSESEVLFTINEKNGIFIIEFSFSFSSLFPKKNRLFHPYKERAN